MRWILSHLQTAEATEREHRSFTGLADVKENSLKAVFTFQVSQGL